MYQLRLVRSNLWRSGPDETKFIPEKFLPYKPKCKQPDRILHAACFVETVGVHKSKYVTFKLRRIRNLPRDSHVTSAAPPHSLAQCPEISSILRSYFDEIQHLTASLSTVLHLSSMRFEASACPWMLHYNASRCSVSISVRATNLA
jgi:hypothetical protein